MSANLGLETDMGNPNFAGAVNPDSVLHVRFFDKSTINHFESEKQGRPVSEMRTYVHIETPGNQLSIIDTFAYDYHKARFPLQWAHYLNSKDGSQAVAGTMLSDWPILTAAQVDELKYFKFYTVEQVAGASDANIGQIGIITGMSPYSFRDKAALYLKAAKDSAFVSQQDDLIKQQAAALAEMQKQIDALKAAPVPPAVVAPETAKDEKSGRPTLTAKPKEQATA